jgi:hypothetical protein
MSARTETESLMLRLERAGMRLEFRHANDLRRAQKTLHRWYELECGDGNDYASWAIERDDETGLPYMCHYPHDGKSWRERIADREKGALKRVAHICAYYKLGYYHQTDPRGCALYVASVPLTDQNYSTTGIGCYS